MSAPDRSQQRQLGELMTELGMITREQLAVALQAQGESGRALGQIIVEMGFSSGAAVAHALAIQSGGALRTEYGYALGLPSRGAARGADDAERAAERDEGGHAMKIPRLRLVEGASRGARQTESQPADSPMHEGASIPPDIETPGEPAASSETTAAEDGTAPLEERRDPAASEVALEEAATARDRAMSDLADAREALDDARERLAESEETAKERDQARAEVQSLQRVLADLRTAGAEELAAVSQKRDRLVARLGETQEALNGALERLTAADSAAAERNVALAEVGRLQAALAEAQADRTAGAAAAAEECKRLAGELAETQQKLAEAEGLAGAVPALDAERQRLALGLTETQQALREALERLTAVEVEASERGRAATELAAERDRLTQELGDAERALRKAHKRLVATSRAIGARDRARADVQRLQAIVDNQHTLAAHAAVVDRAPQQGVADPEEERSDTDVKGPEPLEPAVGEPGGYVVLIPSANGYALEERTGSPPGAGDVVELTDPETHEISRFIAARVGRSPLPDGGVCVYLLSD